MGGYCSGEIGGLAYNLFDNRCIEPVVISKGSNWRLLDATLGDYFLSSSDYRCNIWLRRYRRCGRRNCKDSVLDFPDPVRCFSNLWTKAGGLRGLPGSLSGQHLEKLFVNNQG